MEDLTNEKIIEYLKEKERKKNYLKRYKKNRACVARLRSKLETLESQITSIKSPRYDDKPKGGERKTTEYWIIEKIDLEKRIEKLEKAGEIIKEETYDIIDTVLSPNLVELLECLFIGCYEMEDTADMLHLSKRQLHRYYTEGLDAITLPKEEDY